MDIATIFCIAQKEIYRDRWPFKLNFLQCLQCLLFWVRKVSGTRPESLWEFNFKFIKQVKGFSEMYYTKIYSPTVANRSCFIAATSSRDTVKMVVPSPCGCPDSMKMFIGTQTLTATCFRSPPSTTSLPLWSWEWHWPWLVTFIWHLASLMMFNFFFVFFNTYTTRLT